ncbi:MAG: hypothetical protein V1664_02625 [Candidatus Uhrbacteria bacterium]
MSNLSEIIRPQLDEQEQKIQAQKDRLYTMASDPTKKPFLKIEYKQLVELITGKYQFLQALLDEQKSAIGSEEYEARIKALQDQYKEDVISLAVVLDEVSENQA